MELQLNDQSVLSSGVLEHLGDASNQFIFSKIQDWSEARYWNLLAMVEAVLWDLKVTAGTSSGRFILYCDFTMNSQAFPLSPRMMS
jgi:hypothetical protein